MLVCGIAPSPRMELRFYYILSNEGGRFSLAR